MYSKTDRESLTNTFFKSTSFLASILLCSVFFVFNSTIIGHTQFENKQQIDILDYENISNQVLDSATEFDSNGTISSNQFETNPDLITTLGSQEGLALNHYGDNPPDVSNLGTWWDDDGDSSTVPNWPYRNCFEVDYSSGLVNLEEYQLYLDFDTQSLISASQMQSGGEDLRVADSSGNLIDHYIADDINTTSTRVWIQPDLITAGATTNYCLYYGNSSAASTSNKESVFTHTSAKPIYYNLAQNADNGIIDFGSYTDNNQITVDNYNQPYSKNETNVAASTTVTSSTPMSSTGPLQATIPGAGVDSVVPLSNAGTEFSYYMDRSTHMLLFVSPLCDANIEIYNTNNLGATVPGGSFTINEGESYNWNESIEGTGSFSDDDGVYITSTNSCPVLMFHSTTGNTDTYPMIPATTEDWYGVGTNNLELAGSSTTTVEVYDSGAGSTTNYTLNAANDYIVQDPGAGSQGQSPSQRVVVTSGGPIGASSVADGDGNEATTLYPRSQMDTKYVIPEQADYVAIATIAGANTTVEVYNDAADCTFGNTSPAPSQTQSANSTNDFPGHILFGTIPQGACLVSNHPIAPIFEKNGAGDESNLWSYKHSRPKAIVEPTITFGSEESGSYNLDGGTVWTNRIPVNVTNNVATTLTQYPIRIPLVGQDILVDAQADGGDVRVGDSSGTSGGLQDYYLEEFGNTFAGSGDIWTQISVAGSSSTTIYLYYNSSGKVDQSNQDNVFSYNSAQTKYYIVDDVPAASPINIYPLVPGTELNYLGTNYTNLDPGENYTDPGVTSNAQGIVTQGEIFNSTGPVNAMTRGNTIDSLTPISYAGTKFISTDTRDIDVYSMVAPFGASTVSFERHDGTGWVAFGADVNLVQNVPQNITRDVNSGTGATPYNSVRITATTPILIHKHADRTGPVVFSDSHNIYPADGFLEESTGLYEAYGVSSGNVIISTENPTTTVNIENDNGTTTGPITIDSSVSNTFLVVGSSHGQGTGMRITADGPFFAQSQADSDGNEAFSFLPKKEFGDEFIFTTGIQYISIVGDDSGTVCTVFNDDDTVNTSVTLGTNPINLGFLGDSVVGNPSQFFKGQYMTCTNPVFAYYEKNEDDSDPSNITDETNFLTFAQGRQQAAIEPIVTDIDDVSVVEEGLFYESGFDSSGAGSLPVATYQYIFDSTSLNVAWESINIAEGTFDSAVSNNSVTPISGTIESASSGDCNSATYTSSSTLSSGINQIPSANSNNNCLRVTFQLQTGDPSHSPVIDSFDIQYSNPDSIEDYLQDEIIVLPASSTDRFVSLFKIDTANSEIDGSILQLSYLGSDNNTPVTKFDLNTYNITLDSTANQFSFPTFPALPTTSVNTVVFEGAQPQVIQLEYNRAPGGSPSSVDLLIEVLDGSNLDPLLEREVTVTINP